MPELPPDFPHDKFDYGDGKNIATTFVTPIAHYSNTEFLEELKSYIINDDKSEESGISPDIKHNLYESKFDLLQRDVEVIKTAGDWFKLCMKHAFNYMEHAPNIYDINFRDSWYHITKTNGTHAGHTHQNCSWCGIYYIDVGDNNSGHTIFDNPIRHTYSDYGNSFYGTDNCYRIIPKNGQLVLFPSYLYHYQALYTGGKDRIVIGFNAQVEYHSTMLGLITEEDIKAPGAYEEDIQPCVGDGCADTEPFTPTGKEVTFTTMDDLGGNKKVNLHRKLGEKQ